MKKFDIHTVLIPLDLSENSMLALEHGLMLAKLFKGDVVLAHVTDPKNISADGTKSADSNFDKLTALAKDIHIKHGIKVSTVIKGGKIAQGITAAAKEINADIIVMGTHGVSGFEEFFMGSNAFRVVTESVCPVLSVQRSASKVGFEKILLPIDNSSSTREKVRYAATIAKKYNSKIHILGILSAGFDDYAAKLEKKLEQVEEYLDKQDIDFESQVVEGENLASLTMKQAYKIGADLICIMTEQEENLTGFFLGPYAQQVVNHSKIPVLSIRPEETEVSLRNI